MGGLTNGRSVGDEGNVGGREGREEESVASLCPRERESKEEERRGGRRSERRRGCFEAAKRARAREGGSASERPQSVGVVAL